MITLSKLEAHVNLMHVASANEVKAFAEKLAGLVNPAYDMEWSDSAFAAAATHKVGAVVGAWLSNPNAGGTDEERVQEVDRLVRAEIMRLAKYPSRSSSAASNVMAEQTLAAWALLAEKISR